MALIRERDDRHFIDVFGQMFWINGPEDCCYLSQQRMWRSGLSFIQVLEWKQCAPTGLVSQRFHSIVEACEAFEQNRIDWTHDLQLHRMGEQMEKHRSIDNYRPTYMKLAEAKGAPVRRPPWLAQDDSNRDSFTGPRCIWPGPAKKVCENNPKIHHQHRSRRCLKEPVR